MRINSVRQRLVTDTIVAIISCWARVNGRLGRHQRPRTSRKACSRASVSTCGRRRTARPSSSCSGPTGRSYSDGNSLCWASSALESAGRRATPRCLDPRHRRSVLSMVRLESSSSTSWTSDWPSVDEPGQSGPRRDRGRREHRAEQVTVELGTGRHHEPSRLRGTPPSSGRRRRASSRLDRRRTRSSHRRPGRGG